MRKIALYLAFAAVVLGFCVRAQAVVNRDIIETTGIGVADPKISNITQRRAGARNAAIVQAQYNMLSIVKSSAPQASGDKVDEMVKGAQVVKTEWADNGKCTVILRLDRARLEAMQAPDSP